MSLQSPESDSAVLVVGLSQAVVADACCFAALSIHGRQA